MHPPRLKIDNKIYFLTICTYKRTQFFKNKYVGNIILESLNFCKDKFDLKIYAWVILYEHLHLLLQVNKGKDISNFLNSFKGFTGKIAKKLLNKDIKSFWQEGTCDHIMRDEEDFKSHYDYIHYNPVKHGIVKKPENYLYSSFSQAVKKGYYEIGWGYKEPRNLDNLNSNNFGE